MDGCEVAIIKQFRQVDLSRCLQCHDSLSLEFEVCLEVLCNLTNQSAFVKKKNNNNNLITPIDKQIHKFHGSSTYAWW